tara:strand:+ start:198 stop:677 length:480 start_codon:yes stop_codon:yes gene_type:complete
MAKFKVIPLTLKSANAYVEDFHRHNKPCVGHRFSIGALDENENIVGVAIIGRPVARMLDDGLTAEVNRLCTNDDSPKNVCSFLYARAWRIWQQMGGERMITYTLQSENGSSLKGAGWKIVGKTNKNDFWNTRKKTNVGYVSERAEQDVDGQLKFRWQAQ